MTRCLAVDKSHRPSTWSRIASYPLAFHAGASPGTLTTSSRISSTQPALSIASTRPSIRDSRTGPGSTTRYAGSATFSVDAEILCSACSLLMRTPESRTVSIARGRVAFGWLRYIDSVVGHARTLLAGWLGGPDVEVTVDLARIRAHDRRVVCRCELQRDRRLSGARRSADDAEIIGGQNGARLR